MDIRKHAVNETSTIHLRDAGDELMYAEDGKTPVTITVYGPGSKQYARAQAAQSNRLIDRMKKKGKADQTADDAAKERAEFLASCTHSMENVEYEGLQGADLFRAVYSDLSIGFVADQVAKHLGEWGNFSKGSPKN